MVSRARVTEVEVIGDHRLRVTFDDACEGELDFSDWNWRGVFEPAADPASFAEVQVDPDGALVWPGGFEIASDTLHAWVERALPAAV